MNSLLLDSPLITDNKDLIRLGVEANQSNWMFAKMNTPGTEMHIESDLFWCTAKQPGLPSLVCGAHFSTEKAQSRIQEVVNEYRNLERSMTWLVTPDSTPTDLSRLLNQQQLRCARRYPMMFARNDQAPAEQTVPNVRIEVMQNLSIFDNQPHPFFVIFMPDHQPGMLKCQQFVTDTFPHQVFNIGAFIEETCVGFCSLFLSGGMSGIYEVGVLPNYRGRGIGTSLSLFAMRQGLASGYQFSTVPFCP